jgi:glycosyltransferase involved in cell wall biosynthesis
VRILHVVADMNVKAGGPARCVAQLAAVMRTRGFEPSIAARGATGPGAEPLGRLPLPWQIPTPWSERRLANAVTRADLVHIHGLWNGTVSVAAYQCRRAGVPYVITPHGMLDPICLDHHAGRKRLYRSLIEGATLRGADGFHFLSAEERDRAVLGRPIAPDAVAVAPNGAPAFSPPAEAGLLRRMFPQVGNRPVALYLGRIDAIKGVDLQLQALARLPERQRPVLLLVGPDYGDERRLRRLTRELRLHDWVVWGTPVFGDDRLALMAEADVVLLTSVYDCNPVVLVEALGAGAVLVATVTCGGIEAAATQGAAVSVPRNPDAVADAIQAVLADRNWSADLRRAAAVYARTRLRPVDLIEPLLGLYERVSLNRARRGASAPRPATAS